MSHQAAKLTLGGLAVAGLAVFLYVQGLDRADKLSSSGSLIIAVASLLLSLRVSRRPEALTDHGLARLRERLASEVRDQWLAEERLHRLQDPGPMPVRWANTSSAIADHWRNIHGTDEPLDLSSGISTIAETYQQIPSGRLVVLGSAGSGKTMFTLRLVLDRLAARQPGERVPVVLPLASWNPVRQNLSDWVASRLILEHPALAARTISGSTAAAELVSRHQLILVLDGLDEVPTKIRPTVLRALNASLDQDDPIILTSRRAEYVAAVKKSDVLTAAAVIELLPLTVDDLAAYLPYTTRPTTTAGGTKWHPVLAALRDGSEAPSRAALSLPLMAALARTAYSDTPANPRDLLDQERFPTRATIEDHLLDYLIPAVYHQREPWRSTEARQWLGFIADQLHSRGIRELAWWEVASWTGDGMRRVITAFAFALPLVLVS
ncbi:MAG TPA: NACHT domain-containing protein, partial [Umezawaea sp.]|nr:NACHT domain-containing protein [Umezawaea sp.]